MPPCRTHPPGWGILDSVGLDILVREMEEDAAVFAQAVSIARERLEQIHPGHLEACGYELNRAYNILEKTFERVCVAFENHFDKRGDYHERLIERMALHLPGIRPALVPPDWKEVIRDLKGFRPIFRHAYDLRLRPARLAEVVEHAESVRAALPRWIQDFRAGAQAMLGSAG